MKPTWTTFAAGCFLALCALHGASGAAATPFASSESRHSATYPALVIVEAPTVSMVSLTQRFPQGSRLVRARPGDTPATVSLLTSGFFAAADPQVSFDGSRILLSAQLKPGARWQIWEMTADGSGQRQVTHCSDDCLEPKYMRQNQLVYTAVSGTSAGQASAVYVCRMDGSDAHPITFGPGNFQVETVLRSGRILISAESPLLAGSAAKRSRTLFTLQPDGSGLALLRDDGIAGDNRGAAIELTNGTIVFLETAGISADRHLEFLQQGALRAARVTQASSDYASVQQLDEGTLVVSMQRPVGPKGRNFDLYAFDLAGKSIGELLYRNPTASSLQAVALMARPLPKIYWSVLRTSENAGRILCLDSYISQDVASGHLAGRIAKVRVLTLQQPGNTERIVGDAPVESDGSFYASVPADTPIRFELLGARGEVLHSQRSWIWVRDGEDRGCQGCHDSQALSPANHFPLTLRRFDTPTPLGIALHAQHAGQP